MALWKVQAGKYDEQEGALDSGLVAIGWNELGDLSSVKTREELEIIYKGIHPDRSQQHVSNVVGQIWAFISRIKVGDWVAVPLRSRSAIAVGVVKGGYQFRADLGANIKHVRECDWLRTDIPRTEFDQDILYSLGAFMTVCQITRNDAENRVKALVQKQGRHDTRPLEPIPVSVSPGAVAVTDQNATTDVEQLAVDQIQQYIARKYRGHKLAQLVDAVLTAQGYVTRMSPPGPDGGVDILVGGGPMGFDSPRICVQVKSYDTPLDVSVLRELRGTMETHSAEHGLLVNWGGFKSSILKESSIHHFKVRLWGQGELLDELKRSYERLPDAMQAELPLKRIWALALEEEE